MKGKPREIVTTGVSVFSAETNWRYKEPKKGGVNRPGPYGGNHIEFKDGKATGRMALIKCDKSPEKNISEFLGSTLFNATNPGYGAEVFLTVPRIIENEKVREVKIPNDGSEVYVRSEFFGGKDKDGNETTYEDMFVDMDEAKETKGLVGGRMRKEGRPMLMGTRNTINRTLDKAFEQGGYTGFEQIAPTSLLISDFDMHTGNIGVVRDKDGKKPKLVRIDFGGAFRNLDDDDGSIHPHSRQRHPGLAGKAAKVLTLGLSKVMGLESGKPTNHFREFSRKHKLTPEFAASCVNNGSIDLSDTIDKSFTLDFGQISVNIGV